VVQPLKIIKSPARGDSLETWLRDVSADQSVKARMRANEAGILRSLVALYSSWTTLLTNGLLFVAYYALFYEVIVYSNSGYFLLTIPSYLLVLLVLTSSCSATIAVSYLRVSRRRRSIPGVVESPVGVALGALVASCSCSLPLLAPTLYFIGLNAIEVSGVISFLASYQAAIFEAIIAFNLLSIYYYLRLFSRSGMSRSAL
jgi:hypothetical protein